MSFIDHTANEINFKIVYYGPGLSGKTTNMQHIYHRTAPEQRGQMRSVATETERTLSFDLRPATLPPVRGLGCRLHLCTVPGPVFYDASRVLILKDVDGIIFVADSQRERDEANVESLENLETNLAAHGGELARVPLVLQYNKRDLETALPVAELDALLGASGRARVEAVAMRGEGVFETLKAVVRQVLAGHR